VKRMNTLALDAFLRTVQCAPRNRERVATVSIQGWASTDPKTITQMADQTVASSQPYSPLFVALRLQPWSPKLGAGARRREVVRLRRRLGEPVVWCPLG